MIKFRVTWLNISGDITSGEVTLGRLDLKPSRQALSNPGQTKCESFFNTKKDKLELKFFSSCVLTVTYW